MAVVRLSGVPDFESGRSLLIVLLLFLFLVGAANASAAELSAEDFVSLVLRENPSLQAHFHMNEAATNRAIVAGQLDDPMLMYGAAPLALLDGNWVRSHQVELSQSFPWPGKLGLARDIATAERDIQLQSHRAAVEERATMARLVFADTVEARLELRSLDDEVQRLTELRKFTAQSLGAGTVSQSDLFQVDAELQMSTERRIGIESRIRRLMAALRALAGNALPPNVELAAPELPPALSEPTEILAQPRTREVPAVAQARLESRQAEMTADLARRERYPDVELFVGLNTMWEMREHRFMTGVRLNLPVRRARRNADIDAAQSNRQAMSYQVAGAETERQQAVDEALADLDGAERLRTLVAAEILPLAERRIASTRAAYGAGQVPVDALIQAYRAHIRAVFQLEQAKLDRYRAGIRLAYASGLALDAFQSENSHAHE
jgi:outer membrane protein, heavy metal efflux system